MGTIQLNCCQVEMDNLPEEEITKRPRASVPQMTTNFSLNANNYVTNDTLNSGILVSPSTSQIPPIVKIQKCYRGYIGRKNFESNLELLNNILTLDTTVNLVKTPEIANNLIANNKGEQLSRELLSKGIITPFEKKQKPSKYKIESALSYIDKYQNNDMYVGSISLEKKYSGYGILYSNDNKYEGYWENSKLNGKGRYFLANGDFFEGYFENDKVKGYGKYIHRNGTIYEGNWINDVPEGKGKELFPDGSTFEGYFINGKKIKGKFDWKDGSYYDGEIKNELFEGEGLFHWAEGREYIGEWKEGKMNGKGTMNYCDGSKYEGEFIQGKRSGFGKYTWNKDKIYEGYWLDGKQHGNGSYIKNGVVTNGVWINGKMVNENKTGNSTVISQSDTLNLNFLNEKMMFGKKKSTTPSENGKRRIGSNISGLNTSSHKNI